MGDYQNGTALVEISPILYGAADKVFFECPGCKCLHGIRVHGSELPRWGYNNNPKAPTFTPSVLVEYPMWEPPAYDPEIAAKIKSGEIVQTKVDHVCHSFVTDGQIQFLMDCTHELKGQTVPLPRLEEND